MRIAEAVEVSPAWIMFGVGPIRASQRDVQAIRHQNLVYVSDQLARERGKTTRFLNALGISRKKFNDHIDNPFFVIQERLARRAEKYLKKPLGWFDEQHVESDPLCLTFPEDLRELMSIFSELHKGDRERLLRVARVFADTTS